MIRTVMAILKNKLGVVQYPLFITFFVTWRCNCKCIMCDIWKKQKNHELTADEIKQIFRQLKPIDAIRISGGEPFLREDLSEIINIIDETVSPKIIHITTNGLLTEHIVATLKKIRAINKVHLKVSIDDIGAAHDKIRGVKNAYEMAIATIKILSQLRKEHPFYLGVNQTIVNEKGFDSYNQLKSILSSLNVNVHAVIAYEQYTGLYSGENMVVNPELSYRTFGNLSKDKLGAFVKSLLKEADDLDNFEEKLLKKYHLKGLYNRLIKNKNNPNPRCVALNSHLRILPNGDIPVCMYNSTIVGSLKKEKFKDIWFSPSLNKQRQWVKKCKGCWAGCEANVNGIYSGDIWKGFL